jgi:hypothetical protein
MDDIRNQVVRQDLKEEILEENLMKLRCYAGKITEFLGETNKYRFQKMATGKA